MRHRPPLNDSIVFALAKLVDDAQKDRRDPSHSDIEFCIKQCNLVEGDPNCHGQTVGKAKRVRAVLSWAIENAFEDGQGFVDQLIAMVRTNGGFRNGSQYYVGDEAIRSLSEAMASEGFLLASDGELRPAALESLSGSELTKALEAYVRRAQRGAEDAGLLVGTGKDLLEAISVHVLYEFYGQKPAYANFPTLLGQAFDTLGLKTPAHKPVDGEPAQSRLQRGLFEAACAVNTLRNKQGTGHGRPWLPSVGAGEARHFTQVMGVVGELLLRTLKQKKGQ